jgi:hypothetical protein
MKTKSLIFSLAAILLIIGSYVGYRYYINHKVERLCQFGVWDEAIELDSDCFCGYLGRGLERLKRANYCGACDDLKKAKYLASDHNDRVNGISSSCSLACDYCE